MISRTTDDYEAMARAGIVAVIEPAFWLGQPRTSPGSFLDYLRLITGFERFRAGQFGIRHYCTIGLNPKEANNEALAEAVIGDLPRFLSKEGVVAMGELGYDEQTALEDKVPARPDRAREGVRSADHDPHAPSRQKRGTLRTMDVLNEHGFDPGRCVIDHNNEETISEVMARGYWWRSRSIPRPRWATSGWPRSCAATVPSGLSSIRPATGACRIRSRCRRPRG